jgi:hypothetical protein
MSKVVSDTTSTSYAPSLLNKCSYQWRIDTKNSVGLTTGDVWTFTTIPLADVNTPPVASNSSVGTYQYETVEVNLPAVDDGKPIVPGKLKYVVRTLPNKGTLQDPMSGAGIIKKVPYTLSTWGHKLWYSTDVNGATSFTWDANDSGNDAAYSGKSNTATASITITKHPLDFVSLDGKGYMTVADSDYLKRKGSWGVILWIRTRDSFGTILKKHSTGKGFEVKLNNGFVRFEIYDASNNVQYFQTSNFVQDNVFYSGKVNTGTWQAIGIGIEPNLPNNNSQASIYLNNGNGNIATFSYISDVNNTEPLYICGDGSKNIAGDKIGRAHV